MSQTSPADLSIAFRGFGRRLAQAVSSAAPERRSDAEAKVPELEHIIRQAAALMGSGPGSDVSTLGASVADSIDAVAADGWDSRLDQLRTLASDAGAKLRDIERTGQ